MIIDVEELAKMQPKQALLKVYESGLAKILLDIGQITPTVYENYNRYIIYNLTREQDNGHMEAVKITAKLTKASPSTVRRSLDFFK
jgi:hypothetical protein